MLSSSGRSCQMMNQLREDIAAIIQWTRFRDEKENLSEISRRLKCDIRIVRDVRNRIDNNQPVKNLYNKQKKSKITDAIGKYIESITIANRSISSQAIAELIFQNYQVVVSRALVNNYRHLLGFKYGPQIKTFVLNDAQKQKRLNFAKSNINTNFDNVLFTDESYFELNGLRWVWRRKGEVSDSIVYPKEAHPLKLMVWGGISKRYKTPLIIFEKKETMDAHKYVNKILKGTQLEDKMNAEYPDGWVLMQDNAPPHNARITKDYLDQVGRTVLEWPPHSPDLNVIEHVWAWIKRKVCELMPKTIEDLVYILNFVWNSIDQCHIDNLVNSMPKRLEMVIKNQGGQITQHLSN